MVTTSLDVDGAANNVHAVRFAMLNALKSLFTRGTYVW